MPGCLRVPYWMMFWIMSVPCGMVMRNASACSMSAGTCGRISPRLSLPASAMRLREPLKRRQWSCHRSARL